jgi:hypothetical protein
MQFSGHKRQTAAAFLYRPAIARAAAFARCSDAASPVARTTTWLGSAAQETRAVSLGRRRQSPTGRRRPGGRRLLAHPGTQGTRCCEREGGAGVEGWGAVGGRRARRTPPRRRADGPPVGGRPGAFTSSREVPPGLISRVTISSFTSLQEKERERRCNRRCSWRTALARCFACWLGRRQRPCPSRSHRPSSSAIGGPGRGPTELALLSPLQRWSCRAGAEKRQSVTPPSLRLNFFAC